MAMAITDGLGKTITFNETPHRIVSTVPSLTEYLYHLGLKNQIVGRTKFCIHPSDQVTLASKIGGTKTLDINKILNLSPDLIIANQEENVKEQIEELAESIPVYTTKINTIKDAAQALKSIALIFGKEEIAKPLIDQISTITTTANLKKIKTLYLIWQNPYMTIGGDTYISDMLTQFGFENVYHQQNRYPAIDIQAIIESDAELIMLSSEPFPFKQKHLDTVKSLVPNKKVVLVDGEMLSWYGHRMLAGMRYTAYLHQSIASET